MTRLGVVGGAGPLAARNPMFGSQIKGKDGKPLDQMTVIPCNAPWKPFFLAIENGKRNSQGVQWDLTGMTQAQKEKAIMNAVGLIQPTPPPIFQLTGGGGITAAMTPTLDCASAIHLLNLWGYFYALGPTEAAKVFPDKLTLMGPWHELRRGNVFRSAIRNRDAKGVATEIEGWESSF